MENTVTLSAPHLLACSLTDSLQEELELLELLPQTEADSVVIQGRDCQLVLSRSRLLKLTKGTDVTPAEYVELLAEPHQVLGFEYDY